MKYYKDEDGNVYTYSPIQTPKPGLIPMSQEEIDEHLNPPPQPDPIPEEVEGWQAEVAMRATQSGDTTVWDRVQDLFSAMPEGLEKITAQTVLRRGKIRRDSPLLAQLAPQVPLTQGQVDDLFIFAHSLVA